MRSTPVSRFRGWLLLVLMPIAAALVASTLHWPRWGFMWALATAIFFGCKWLKWRRTPRQLVPAWRQLCYLFAWPGMDAVAFFNPQLLTPKPGLGEWSFAVAKTVIGVLILCVVARAPAAYGCLLARLDRHLAVPALWVVPSVAKRGNIPAI